MPILTSILLPILGSLAPPVAAGVLVVAGPTAAAPWQPPVTPVVVERPFAAPADPYAPGHRGVDLAATAGQTVVAPAPGVVRVAGRVAGKAVISIEHPHRLNGSTGWRTTYEGVAASVHVNQRVSAGDSIGVVVAHPHSRGIHWGLKNGRVYADPLALLRRPVVLKPLRN
ncbi:MAG: M23 family metallopeptidase [Actinobacteria bacterium]|nr:M23 family metallopeptidase [Actinomycetota bacterium]